MQIVLSPLSRPFRTRCWGLHFFLVCATHKMIKKIKSYSFHLHISPPWAGDKGSKKVSDMLNDFQNSVACRNSCIYPANDRAQEENGEGGRGLCFDDSRRPVCPNRISRSLMFLCPQARQFIFHKPQLCTISDDDVFPTSPEFLADLCGKKFYLAMINQNFKITL